MGRDGRDQPAMMGELPTKLPTAGIFVQQLASFQCLPGELSFFRALCKMAPRNFFFEKDFLERCEIWCGQTPKTTVASFKLMG